MKAMHPLSDTISKVRSRSSRAIRDPLWGHIYLPAGFMDLLSTGPFTKLRGILQLGPCRIVYPGACHDRFSHSLGVYWIAFRFLEQFAQLPDPGFLTGPGSLSFLAAALCHDLGHFPFTHSLKELPLRDHESLSGELVTGPVLAPLLAQAGADPDSVAAIIDHHTPVTDRELLFYRSVLSGVLDPDKLDYLRRDALFCGVPYGTQDLDYLLSRLRISQEGRVILGTGDVSVIEHLLFSKYLMYKAVYWHRDVRSATAMMKKFLHRGITSGWIAPESLYHLDDHGFGELARKTAMEHRLPDVYRNLQEGRTWQVVLETDAADLSAEQLSGLEDLDRRGTLEKQLGSLLFPGREEGADRVIIDVPENISFEVDFPLESSPGSVCTFLEAGTVFSGRTVESFTGSLRKVRVLVAPDTPVPAGTLAGAWSELFPAGKAVRS